MVRKSAFLSLAAASGMELEDVAAVQALIRNVVTAESGRALVEPGQESASCHVLLDGMAYRSVEQIGIRQITNFLLPGDIVDLHLLFYPRCTFKIVTCTEARFGLIRHSELSDLMAQRRNVSEALWRLTLRDAAIEREWLLNVCRRTVQERVAHLLSEIVVRLETVGRFEADERTIPLSSLNIASAINEPAEGVEIVLRSFDERGLLIARRAGLLIRDAPALKALAGFDPAYLSLEADMVLA